MRRFRALLQMLLLSWLILGACGCGEDPSTKPKVVKGGLDSNKATPQENAQVKVLK